MLLCLFIRRHRGQKELFHRMHLYWQVVLKVSSKFQPALGSSSTHLPLHLGAVYMLAYLGYVPTDEYQKLKKAAQEDKAALAL